MPSTLVPHYINRPADVPYIANVSPVETRPHWVNGQNVATSIKGQVEKRPGHAAFETTPTTFGNTVTRIFTWRLWGGAFFVMVNVVGGGQSIVYKYKIGTDTSFVSIFTSAVATAFDFTQGNNVIYFGNGTDMKKYDGTTVTGWGIAKPAAAPAAVQAAGALSTFAGGYSWRYAFGNSTTGHIGQISDPATYTGNVTSKQFTITGSNTTDAQVNQVHIYRTGDGGATWYELPNSPITYVGGWSLLDTAANTALNTANQASLPGQNAPPTAAKSCAYYAGRIWIASGDAVYYSAFEESINGIQQESFPTINKYTFGQEVTGLAVCQNSLLVFGRSLITRITGDSLATFVRKTFKTRAGVDNQANIAQGGGNIVAWLDTTNTVWATDGITTQELGLPIRTDLAGYTITTASVSFHSDSIRRWLVISDAASSASSVFDCDQGQWMPGKWTLGGYAIHSGETSPGAYTLLRTTNAGTRVLSMSPSTFTDNGSTYSENLISCLMELSDGKGPGEVGVTEFVAIDRNTVALSDVLVLTDDDPAQGTFVSVFSNEINPPDRTQGSFVISKFYPLRGGGGQATAQRAAVKFVWNAQSSKWELYTVNFVSSRVEEIYSGESQA